MLPHPTTLPLIAHYTNLLQDSPSPDCLAPESPLTNLAFQDIYPASQRACSKPICSLKTLKHLKLAGLRPEKIQERFLFYVKTNHGWIHELQSWQSLV